MVKKLNPDIFLFNPTFEYAVANGNASWQPNKILQKMESDLATLFVWMAKPGDIILTDNIPSHEFIETIKLLKPEPPLFSEKERVANGNELTQAAVNRLLPWGWSPAAHNFFAPLKNSCSPEFKESPVFNWNKQSRIFYSRKFALSILTSLIEKYPDENFIINEYLPKIVTTKQEIEELIKKWDKIVVKAPWSSSGRGLQPVTKTPVHEKVWEKLLAIITDQGFAVTEPLFNKVFDLAFQFELKNGKVTYLGTSRFITDKKGQYAGNSLNDIPDNTEQDIKEFVKTIPVEIINPLIKLIESSELAVNYEGYFGIDTLIYRDSNNSLKINPCLEINVKFTMGLLSLHLEKLIHHNKKGVFRTYYKPGTNFLQFTETMQKKHPLIIKNNKIVSGFFPLTETKPTSLFGAYILV